MEGEDIMSDSDDDLVAPDFLSKVKVTELKILSPRRAIKPSGETLSPLPNLGKDTKIERSCKSKISLASLLTEKRKDDIVQKNSDDIYSLKTKFQKDDYMDLVRNELDCSQDFSQMSNMSNDYEDSQELSATIKSKQNKNDINEEEKENRIQKSKRFINDFPDTFPGEKLFTLYREAIDLKPALKCLYMNLMDCDEFEAARDINCEDDNDLLCTIVDSYLPHTKKLNSITCKSLWEILCYCQDAIVGKTTLQLLTKSVLLNNSSNAWVPSTDDFVEAFKKCGADANILVPDYIAELIGRSTEHIKVDLIQTPLSPKSIRKCFLSRLDNFQCIVKLMTTSIQSHPSKYTIKDLNYMVILVMRLTVERLVQSVICDIVILVATILDAYEQILWKDVVEELWNILVAFSMHHRNLLQLIGSISPTKRGTEFRDVFAFNTASLLIRKNNKYLGPPVKIVRVFHLISSIQITDESDYFELYSALTLIGLCINTDEVKSGQRANMMKLRDKLHLLHGEIKECKGTYLDRAKVKDVILRMVSRFKFVVQAGRSQAKLDSYFDSQSSVVPIETISTNMTNSSQNMSSQSQEKNSQSQDMNSESQEKNSESQNMNLLIQGIISQSQDLKSISQEMDSQSQEMEIDKYEHEIDAIFKENIIDRVIQNVDRNK